MKKRNIIIIVITTILVLYFALKDNYLEIIPLLFKASLPFLILGFLLVLSYCFFKACLLHNIINKFKKYSFTKTFNLQIMTFFFNGITPFATGGQPFQVYVLAKAGLTLSEGTSVIAQESILHQISIIILSVIVLILNNIFNICKINNSLLILGFLINLVVLILLFVLAYFKKIDKIVIKWLIKVLTKFKIIKHKDQTILKINEAVNEFNIGSKILLNNKLRLLKLIIVNIIGLITLYIIPLVILFSLGDYTSFNGITSIVLVTFIALISSFIPLPGGTGGCEYLFMVLFGYYLKNPLLSSVMLLWRFITYYLPMIVGAILFNIKKEK
ncbi:MAG: flippase-like domain-containing protein [Bacilli bacterium]